MALEKTQLLGSEAVAEHPWNDFFNQVKAFQGSREIDSVTIGEANGDRILKESELVMNADILEVRTRLDLDHNIRWTRQEVVNRQTRAKVDQVNYG